ncbi:hypothetical protein AMQ83_16800 [Paenibacillus riograndensis]|nr:hypothetical protein AMQ83_16800 [Paenibacillus riograndensis]
MLELAQLDAKEIYRPHKPAVVDLKTSPSRAIEIYGLLLKSRYPVFAWISQVIRIDRPIAPGLCLLLYFQVRFQTF